MTKDRKTICFACDSETHALIKSILPETNTGQKNCELIISALENAKQNHLATIEALNNDLQVANAKIAELNTLLESVNTDLQNVNNDLQLENQQLTTENADLKQQLFTANGLAPKENDLLLTLPLPCKKLLFEYAKRLETPAENILIYTFFRYCVERLTINMWDFTVIKEREFEEICDVSYSEIKKMLKLEK